MSNTDKQEAIATLRNILKPNYDTIYTVLRHRSASGMTRFMDLYVMRDNQPRRLTWQAAKALGWTYDTKREALKVGGCGMDMGFHAVYTLSCVLFSDEKGRYHGADAGYALNHEWI